jgi:ABC-type transport system involved in multi-copper enzyme maturation permease subunit
MSSTALTSARQQTRAPMGQNPLSSVLVWEFRRFCASRLFWLQAFGLFCFLFLLTWLAGTAMTYSTRDADGFIPGTSTWGLLLTLPTTVLLLVLLLPFVAADAVTRDLTRHTHELLMTTAVPSWAYVWGRYLIGLLMSLGLAVLLLAAILGMGLLQHLTILAYPTPQIDAVLLLWVGMVVPAAVLVSGLSFALSTLLPHLTSVIKILILVGWVVGAEVLPLMIYFPSGPTNLPTWYSGWDPTSAVTALVMFRQYSSDASQQTHAATSAAQLQQMLNSIASQMPDISAWFAPHLIEAGLSLLLVVLAAFTFQRFRNTFNG